MRKIELLLEPPDDGPCDEVRPVAGARHESILEDIFRIRGQCPDDRDGPIVRLQNSHGPMHVAVNHIDPALLAPRPALTCPRGMATLASARRAFL